MSLRRLIDISSGLTENATRGSTGSFLLELRRNPDVNRKEAAIDALRRYTGRKDVFVSFTLDVGTSTHNLGTGDLPIKSFGGGKVHNVSGAKIGINPQSPHDTPTGIYGYPVDYVLEKNMAVPYAGQLPFIWVFQIAPGIKVLDFETYTLSDLKRDIKRLDRHAYAEVIDQALYGAKHDTPAAKLWNVTRLLAGRVTQERMQDRAESGEGERMEAAYKYYLHYHGLEDDPEVREEFEDQYHDSGSDPSDEEILAETPPRWSKLLRSLGYGCAIDLEGSGLIHGNEPTQGVFFSKDALKTIELVRNISPAEPMSQTAIWSKSPRSLIAAIRNGQIGDEPLYNLLLANPRMISAEIMQIIPEAVAQRLRDNAPELLANSFGGDVLSSLGLNDRQMVAVLRAEPRWARTLDTVSSGVAHYIEANIINFAECFLDLPLAHETLMTLLDTHPNIVYSINHSHNLPAWYQAYVGQKKLPVLDNRLWADNIEPSLFASIIKRQFGANASADSLQGVFSKCVRMSYFDRLEALAQVLPQRTVAASLRILGSSALYKMPMAARQAMSAGRPAIQAVLDKILAPST